MKREQRKGGERPGEYKNKPDNLNLDVRISFCSRYFDAKRRFSVSSMTFTVIVWFEKGHHAYNTFSMGVSSEAK
jgi:hypothetical protein